MTLEEFMKSTQIAVAKQLNMDNLEDDIEILATELRYKALGFETDSWGHIENISDEFQKEVIEELKPELTIFRKKIRTRLKTRVDKLDKIPYKQRIDDLVQNVARDALREELEKIHPKIKEIMTELVHEQLGDWQALIRMKEAIK